MINKSTFLKDINFPSDLRKISEKDLPKVANEVRNEMIDAVSQTGGHLGAGLGVVELTVALHYVFDTPNDKLIWDVGHQSYPHKILTGRKDKIRRGKASTHVKYGESTAVLAGNSLLTMAFEILSNKNLDLSEKTKVSLIKKLSECSGHLGIAGGQYLDLNLSLIHI